MNKYINLKIYIYIYIFFWIEATQIRYKVRQAMPINFYLQN